MVIVLFLISLLVGGIVLSAVPVGSMEKHADTDYHYVPFSGDAFGAYVSPVQRL